MVKPTCWKKHFGKYLSDTIGCFGCANDDNKVRDRPTIAAKARESKKVPPNVSDGGALKRNRFYGRRAKGLKRDDDDDVSKL